MAWFTLGSSGNPRVLVALSSDRGKSFPTVHTVAEGTPLGRVDVGFLADHSVVISWIAEDNDVGSLQVRRFLHGGEAQASIAVAPISASRASGFPSLATRGDRALVVWTDIEKGPQVRAALLDLDELDPPPPASR